MSTGAFPPPLPFDDNGDPHEEEPVREDADGDEVLDEDANDDLIDSAEADRLASQTDDDQ
ncbi:hypothetical protein ET475_04240 [Microbacterium protaetiae]|uniref:Uncharacterized protein n=1 Tax=Microbacterium protaetiae TaxID=2509458 RepID=A0A4P6ECD2_9MICO|nr:hypothetical protein [Microbacterium protaetiae]QAY59276.1 hypothetical protein ET475_04240 [Microbacterium protaetiae]